MQRTRRRRRDSHLVRNGLAALTSALFTISALASPPPAELVSLTDIAARIEADGSSTGPFGISPNGRFVLFASTAGNLVSGDINGRRDLFVHDRTTGDVARIDTGEDAPELAVLGAAGVSDDGRYVVFDSRSASLVNEPTNGVDQVYRLDRSNGTVTMLSRSSSSGAGVSSSNAGNVSADGRFSVFSSAASNLPGGTSPYEQIYVHDANDGSLRLASVAAGGAAGGGNSSRPQLSADGRYVLFLSEAENLIAGDTNFREDLFLHDLQSGMTQRVSVSTTGAQLPEPSPTPGVRFFSLGCSLTNLSHDGRYAVFATSAAVDPADSNGLPDVYRFDRTTGATQRVSADQPPGQFAYSQCAAVSADGQRIAWLALDSVAGAQLFTYYIRDTGANQHAVHSHTAPELAPTESSLALAGDGSALIFASSHVEPDRREAQLFRADTASGTVQAIGTTPPSSVGPFANDHSNDRFQGAGNAVSASVSADGRYVAFASQASNLVAGDTNGAADVFVRDRQSGTTRRVSVQDDDGESTCASAKPTLSADARFVVFDSCGALAAPASGTQREVYRYTLASGLVELVSIAADEGAADGASEGAHISADGRFVAFTSCATDLTSTSISGCQVYVRDLQSAATSLVSRNDAGEPALNPANGRMQSVRISASGRFVAYASRAPNLAAGDTNNQADAFVHDRDNATTYRASVTTNGAQGDWGSYPYGVSDDGERIVFTSLSTNFAAGATSARARVYLRDRSAAATRVLALSGDAEKSGDWPALSADGRRIAFVTAATDSGMSAFDDSGRAKLILFDDADGSYRPLTWYAAAAAAGAIEAPRFSADGRFVVFNSTRSDLDPADGNGAFTDVFLTDLMDRLFADDFQ